MMGFPWILDNNPQSRRCRSFPRFHSGIFLHHTERRTNCFPRLADTFLCRIQRTCLCLFDFETRQRHRVRRQSCPGSPETCLPRRQCTLFGCPTRCRNQVGTLGTTNFRCGFRKYPLHSSHRQSCRFRSVQTQVRRGCTTSHFPSLADTLLHRTRRKRFCPAEFGTRLRRRVRMLSPRSFLGICQLRRRCTPFAWSPKCRNREHSLHTASCRCCLQTFLLRSLCTSSSLSGSGNIRCHT